MVIPAALPYLMLDLPLMLGVISAIFYDYLMVILALKCLTRGVKFGRLFTMDLYRCQSGRYYPSDR